MGLDWRRTTWGEYQTALAGWMAQNEDAGADPDFSRLKRAMDAHTVH